MQQAGQALEASPRPGACPCGHRRPGRPGPPPGRTGPMWCRTLGGRHLGHAPLGAFPPPSAPADRGSHPARGQPLRPIRLPPPLSAVFSPLKSISPWAGPPGPAYVPSPRAGPPAAAGSPDQAPAWLALCLHWCNPFSGWPTACSAGIWGPPATRPSSGAFGAKDTAQYAAALLHLGHSGKAAPGGAPGLWGGGPQGTHPARTGL